MFAGASVCVYVCVRARTIDYLGCVSASAAALRVLCCAIMFFFPRFALMSWLLAVPPPPFCQRGVRGGRGGGEGTREEKGCLKLEHSHELAGKGGTAGCFRHQSAVCRFLVRRPT